MAASTGKHSLYKLAVPCERSSLPQGKLLSSSGQQSSRQAAATSGLSPSYSRVHQYVERRSEQTQLRENGVDPTASPRRPPPPPSTDWPTQDLAPSLSLSDSSSSSDGSPLSQHYTEPRLPTLVIPSSGSRPVLVVNAETTTSGDILVTSREAPSPVKVVRHTPPEFTSVGDPDRHNWRRFSSNFVTPPMVLKQLGEGAQEERESQRGEEEVWTPRGEGDMQVPSEVEVDQDQTLTNQELCLKDESSPLPGDSIDITELTALAEAAHQRVTGVGRSVSDEVMGQKRWQDDSVHSKSLGIIHEKSGSSLEQSKKKPKKGRVVPSRYMMSTSSSKKPPPSTHQPTTASGRKVPTAGRSNRPKTADDTFKVPALPMRARGSRPPSNQSQFTPQPHISQTPYSFTPSGITTSTPFAGSLGASRQTPAFHDGSFMAMNDPDTSLTDQRQTASKTSKTKPQSQVKSVGDDLELDLWYNRVLQVAHLDLMSAKALREQEVAAMSQLYTLWLESEEKKRENAVKRTMIETEERTQALEKALAIQLEGLAPLSGLLPELEQQYGHFAKALDTTRHDMAVIGVSPVTEEELLTEFVKVDQLLGEIITSLRDKISTASSFANSTEAVTRTVEKEFQELERCWEDLSKVTKTQIHQTSLFFEERQRTRQLQESTTSAL